MSSRPDRISTGTSGPAIATGSGTAVAGQSVHSWPGPLSHVTCGSNGAKGLAPSAFKYGSIVASRVAGFDAGDHGSAVSRHDVAMKRDQLMKVLRSPGNGVSSSSGRSR